MPERPWFNEIEEYRMICFNSKRLTGVFNIKQWAGKDLQPRAIIAFHAVAVNTNLQKNEGITPPIFLHIICIHLQSHKRFLRIAIIYRFYLVYARFVQYHNYLLSFNFLFTLFSPFTSRSSCKVPRHEGQGQWRYCFNSNLSSAPVILLKFSNNLSLQSHQNALSQSANWEGIL